MMAPALLVIVSVFPELTMVALPEPTVPPAGLAKLCPLESPKQAATDSAISLGLKSPRCLRLALDFGMATLPSSSFPQQTGKLILASAAAWTCDFSHTRSASKAVPDG